MPVMINLFGDWHYGRKNLHQRPGTCEHCKKEGTLRSFDTTLFFVVFFIPVLPLGKRRMIDYCPACREGRCIPLKKWREMKERALREAREKFSNLPEDPKAAIDLMIAFASYHDRAAFEEAVPSILERFGDDPKVLKNLVSPMNGSDAPRRRKRPFGSLLKKETTWRRENISARSS